MRKPGIGVLGTGLLLALGVAVLSAQGAQKPAKSKSGTADASGNVLVVANGQKITDSDLNRLFVTRRVPEEKRDSVRRKFLDELIDARLVQQYLTSRKVTASKQEVDEQIKRMREAARQRGTDPDKALAEGGYTAESLRQEIALSLAWQHYFDRVVPPEKMKAYFKEHRPEFDGTKVRASRILIKAPPGDEAALEAAEEKLNQLRKQIVEDKISFADAAREHSAAPSAAQGGDVGEFTFRGLMPQQFSREAFGLKKGEISQPFRTRYGVELCLVADRKPGDLSLEDVRDDVRTRMSEELHTQTKAELRKTAKIEWKSEPQ